MMTSTHNIAAISLANAIADKRFALDAVRRMAWHPLKAITLKNLDEQLRQLQKQQMQHA